MRDKKNNKVTRAEGQVGVVPQVRFPEFRENWSKSLLGNEVKEFRLNSTIQDEYEVLTSARRGLIRQVDYYGEGRITERNNVGFNVIPPDYVTYRSRTDNGRFYFNHNDLGITGIISVYYPVFSSVTGSNAFLATLLNHFSILIGSHSVGTSQRVLPLSKLLRVMLPIPDPAEQQKIADCLTSLDELIATQAQKVAALKTHKKGLMQQLFPREGETQPRLRFPEFRDDENWKAKTLAEVIEIASGQVDPREPPYCDALQIGSENIESHTGRLVNVKSASDKGIMSGNYAFDEGDVLYSKIRPALNKVAAPNFRGICSADIYPIRPANGGLIRIYLLYLLLSQKFLDYAIRNSERGKIPKINRDALLTYEVLIPSPAEQQRIAYCLCNLDELITTETQKLETLKHHKRGLMQQLFPSPDETSI